jgi:hypothetical protein
MVTSTVHVQSRSATKATGPDAAALDYAVRLIHQVCCFAGSFDLLEEFRDQALCTAVERHDSAVLFDRLMYDFSFQGISDEIAINYMARHGRASWRAVRKNLARRPSCPKLKTYWAFDACRYEKTSRTCAEPDHIRCATATSTRLPTASTYSFATLPMATWSAGSMASWTNLRRNRCPKPASR